MLRGNRIWGAVGIVWIASMIHAAELPPAVLIQQHEQAGVDVVPIRSPSDPLLRDGRGILLWREGEREFWRPYPRPTAAAQAGSGSRSVSARSADGDVRASALSFTTQLDQLMGLTLVRGAGFVTPAHQSLHLNPRLTIRRAAEDEEPRFPATNLVLAQADRQVATIAMNEGQATLKWNEIADLPPNLEQGLPPGDYTLRGESGETSTSFTIEEEDVRQWVMRWPARVAGLLGSQQHPLYLHLTVDHLLAQLDEDGKPIPYYADALNLLESASEDQQTPFSRQMAREILARLQRQQPAAPVDDPTGISEIDEARRLIALGRWGEALEKLDDASDTSPRAAALAVLYRAVVLAESGQTTADLATDLFEQAVAQLRVQQPADALRAHNNYAGFFLNQSQDQLHNHAFRIATGARHPLLSGLVTWNAAKTHYDAALKIARELGPEQAAFVQVSQARLYSLLADILRTLDDADARQRPFADAEAAAVRQAEMAANAALAGDNLPALPRGSAHEILAALAFRRGDYETSQGQAERALHHYLQAGSLAGCESVYRLLGLGGLRRNGKTDAGVLNSFLLSHEIAELLRGRMPADQAGLSRTGFFARRAYVNELIIELLIAADRDREALQYAEAAKARSLQDVLSAQRVKTRRSDDSRSLGEILDEWPQGSVALQYFLGSERGWLFVVRHGGTVEAHPLADPDGRAVSTRKLVESVTQFLRDMDHTADKMKARGGFDHAWQHESHGLYQVLIPEAVRNQVRTAEQLVVIPHHVLHYLPFAALVTEPDRERSRYELSQPAFLLDQGFSISYAPSLAARDALKQQSEPLRDVYALGIVNFQGRAADLPGVEQDLENLKSVFGGRVKKIVPGAEARESDLKALLRRRGLLMVATHGHNFADNPLSSFLLCHPDRDNDGRLTAGEIFATGSGADLVVTSACYTGLADRSPLPGDDLFGLQRALLHSGTRAVVSGTWDVYDGSAPELIKNFYQRMNQGQPAAKALTDAQRAFLTKYREHKTPHPFVHPYFWAMFTINGDDDIRFATE